VLQAPRLVGGSGLADQPPSTPAGTRLREGKRLPGAFAAIGVGLVVALLVTIYGTFRWGWTWTGYKEEDNASLWGWLHLVLLPVTIALLPLWLRSRARRKAFWRVGFSVFALVFAVLVVGGYRRNWGWTGFKGNTLWNWLELLLVPFALPTVIAWATTPPPAPTPDERVVPDPALQQRADTAGPVADVLAASHAEHSVGASTHVRAPVDPVELDATDPGFRLASRHLPAPLSPQRHNSPSAAGTEPVNQTPPTEPQTDRPKLLPGAESGPPPADRRPTDAGSGTGGVAPAHSAPARLVQAHPALAIATSFTIIGLLIIAALLPGRAPQPSTAATYMVTVSSRESWTDSGIHLTKGEQVTITASGQVDHDGRSPSPPVGPDGDPRRALSRLSILRDAPHAALIGKIIGNTEGHPFLVGSQYHADSIDQSGLLLLGVNDQGLTNNTGGFTARIQVAMPSHPTE
jgi:hypothetical protein